MYLNLSRSLCVATLFLVACSAQAADTCDDLRSRIEANIAGNGVSDFSVMVVDEATAVSGQVVGHCGNGTRKIVYSRGKEASSASVSPPAAPASIKPAEKPATAPEVPKPGKGHNILTECKDGTVSVGGNCKR